MPKRKRPKRKRAARFATLARFRARCGLLCGSEIRHDKEEHSSLLLRDICAWGPRGHGPGRITAYPDRIHPAVSRRNRRGAACHPADCGREWASRPLGWWCATPVHCTRRRIQRSQHLGFPFKSGHILGIAGQRRGQDLDSDVAIELAVAGAVDLTHAASAEGRDDFVGSEFVAGRERHLGIHPSVLEEAADRFWMAQTAVDGLPESVLRTLHCSPASAHLT